MFDLHAVSIFVTGIGDSDTNIGIEGVELRKTDKRQKSYITIDVFKIRIYSQSG
jgi:hypothetical protein